MGGFFIVRSAKLPRRAPPGRTPGFTGDRGKADSMILDFQLIERLISGEKASERRVTEALDRGVVAKGLSLEDSAALLSIEEPALLKELYRAAG